MKPTVALAGVLCACAWACGQSRAAPPYPESYQRATNEFVEAAFFKPAEPKTKDIGFALAPLILQQIDAAKEPLSLAAQFGTLTMSNGASVIDQSHSAIYWEVDAVQIEGKAHARLSYLWCYSAGPHESNPAQITNNASPGGAELLSPLQGIRITLSAAGQPAIWELLADSTKAHLFFVSQNLEAAAMAEFVKPLPGRRYALERSVAEAPDVVVARVIDDGPVVAGPIVYLNAGTRDVSTLICRCMAAQARKLLATSTYDLLPFYSVATNSLILQARSVLQDRAAFWPGEHPVEHRLEKSLRLPQTF